MPEPVVLEPELEDGDVSLGFWVPVDAELESPEPEDATSLGVVDGVDESVGVDDDEPGDEVDDDELLVFDPGVESFGVESVDVDELEPVEPDEVEDPDEVLEPVEPDEDPVAAGSAGCDDVEPDDAAPSPEVEGDDVEGTSVVSDGELVCGGFEMASADGGVVEVDRVRLGSSSLHRLARRLFR